MRILQLIDSLEAGGAERMAVNYANALTRHIALSALVTTRAEGALKNALDENIRYLFLQKKSTFDLSAIKKLYRFIKENKVSVVHAHSTSLLMAVMVKVLIPKLTIVWHDHYGNSEYLKKRSSVILNFLLRFCDGAIAVNMKLENWIRQSLHFVDTIYLPNFATIYPSTRVAKLEGADNFRIICLANLREQKNHVLLLSVANQIKLTHPQWSFHLVGKDFNDDYSKMIYQMVENLHLGKSVFLYGSRDDTASIIRSCDIAVLCSNSEGLPVALLEYGLLSKPVVVTSVGEIPSIIQDGKNGYLAASGNEEEFHNKLVSLMEDPTKSRFGTELNKTITSTYSEETIIDTYLKWLGQLKINRKTKF